MAARIVLDEEDVYTVTSIARQADVTRQPLGHFRIYCGENGKWLKVYRIAGTFKDAKRYADDWVFGCGGMNRE